MNAVILMWNPDISSFKMDDYLNGMQQFNNFSLNWSVWEHEKTHQYDRFFMVRIGSTNTGIIMSGMIMSEPYKGEDWKGKGREVYYVDLNVSVMVHPERSLLMPSEKLSKQIPDFNWFGGHSGRVLTEEQSIKLLNLWELHQDSILNEFKDSRLAQRNDSFFDPVYKLYSLEAFLKEYTFEVHTNTDEGYEYLDDISYCITLNNAEGNELFIDLEGEFTLTYGEWHTHYMATNDGYECLKEDILSILQNKWGIVVFIVDGKWFGSSTTEFPITTPKRAIGKVEYVFGEAKEFINEIQEKGVEIQCRYWDSSLDAIYQISPQEFQTTIQ